MSDKEMLETKKSARGKSKKKKKKSSVFEEEDDRFEQYLESQKWNTDVEAAFTTNLTKNLPKDPAKDNEQESEVRQWLEESATAGKSRGSGVDGGTETPDKPRRARLCGRACGCFKEIIITKDGCFACVKHVKSGASAMTLECTTWSNSTRRHPWIAET